MPNTGQALQSFEIFDSIVCSPMNDIGLFPRSFSDVKCINQASQNARILEQLIKEQQPGNADMLKENRKLSSEV